ncbi:MAG: hypothetical protein JSV92_04360 [archaeon]|nr:MAG: hypothetical protein JSV92_04360 [archaeon]
MNKGQYFTLEQMLLFTIGIVMTVTIYFSLVTVNESVKGVAEEDQMYEIGKLISSQISRAYNTPNEVTLFFNIPKKISGKGYKIYVENEGTEYNLTVELYNVTMSRKEINIPLNSEYQASGMLFSSSGRVIVTKRNDVITIGRF